MGKKIINMPNHDLMKPMINHTAETSIAIELTVNDGDSVVGIFPYFGISFWYVAFCISILDIFYYNIAIL